MAGAPTTDAAPLPVLGVDGARGGWVGVRWDGTTATPLFAATLRGLCLDAGTVAAVGVDMPIGLSMTARRRCDVEVRPLLGPRRSSLFSPPALGALDHDDYAAANAWSKAELGAGISKQAWMLVPKIREIRALAELSGDTSAGWPLYETFPELSFAAMNAGEPLAAPKRSWNGLATRWRLLAEAGVHLPVDAGTAGSVAADDLLDAAAVAWSARRIVDGRAERRPLEPGPDAGGVNREPTIWW